MKKDKTPHDDFLDEYLKRASSAEELNSEDEKSEEPISVTESSVLSEGLSINENQSSTPIENEGPIFATRLSDDNESKTEENSTPKPKGSFKSESTDEQNKKLKNKRSIYTWAAVLIVIIGISIGYYRHKHSVMQRILVEGNYYTEEKTILSKANIPADVSPDSVDLTKIIKGIEQLPFVKKAEVIVLPPSQVKITIEERKPIALLLDGSKKVLIDDDGILLPQLNSKTPNVPLLYGYSVTQINDTVKAKSFIEMSRFLKALAAHPLSNATISEVAWSKTDGVVAMSSDNGVKLVFGRENPNEVLTNWEAYYTQIVPKVGLGQLAEVDLRYKGLVVTR